MIEQHDVESDQSLEQEIDALRQSLEKKPANIDFIHRLVVLLCQDQDIEGALKVLNEGVWACLEQQRFTSALELLEKMVELRPDHMEAHVEIAKTHLRMGDSKAAVHSFAQAFDVALARRQLDKCQDILGFMRRVDDQGAAVVGRMADLLVAKGEPRRALGVLRPAAEAFATEGQRQDFLEIGKRILAIDPDLNDIRAKVGETLIAEARAFVNYGLHGKAVRALCQAIKYSPAQIETYKTLAKVLVEAGRRSDAVDMAISAASDIDAPERQRELLLFTRQLTGQPEQIDEIAATLDVDLSENGVEDSRVWPFPDSAPQGMGDEDTASGFEVDVEEVTAPMLEEGTLGPVLNKASSVENALTLLEFIDGFSESARLVICDRDALSTQGEIVVHRGRVLAGIRVGGTLFIDEKLHQQAPEFVTSYRQLYDVDDHHGCDQYQEKKTPIPELASATQKKWVTRNSAAAILAIGRQATDGELHVVVRGLDEEPPASRSTSAKSLVMEFASIVGIGASEPFGPSSDGILLEQGHTWRLCRVDEKGQELYLPIPQGTTEVPTLAEVISAIRLAAQLGVRSKVFAGQRSDDGPIGWSFLFDDYAWGALVDDDAIWLARTQPTGLGTLLRLFSDCTTRGAS